MSRPTALVLGAGIMGLSAAWGLHRAGFAVRVLDQAPPPNPRGSSVDDHRLIRHAYGAQAGYMRMVDDAYAAWDLLWRDLGEALHVPTGMLALDEARGAWLPASRAALAADGRPHEDLTGAQVAARFPLLDGEGLRDALWMPTGGVLLAGRIVAALARHLAAQGVAIEVARAFEVDAARGALRLADGRTEAADLLVVAAGPWAPRLIPALAARVTPSRQIIVRLMPEDAEAWARMPMLLDLAAEGGFYMVPPVAGTPLKIGDHSFSLEGDPEADPRVASEAEVERMLALARRRLRGLDRMRLLGGAVCFYDVEPDERFVLERLSPRAFVMSGFSGHGFKFGALLGLAVAGAARDAELDASLPLWAAGDIATPPGLLPTVPA
ncbi:MAG: FAD-dependent oxidoreductase [Acetobacteraceae bacterium]|nr:FAD-dependent oxidoreductase [Acetobacteraceae bacterium]